MTSVFLVRHGATDMLGHTVAGRKQGVSLNDEGRAQAARLARRFEREAVAGIHCSPLERARETAEPIGDRLGVPVEIAPRLNEIDLGDWTDRPLEELDKRPDWQRWNAFRSMVRAPGGESMLEVQARVVGHIAKLADRGGQGGYILVSHADPIKAALLYFLGAAIDFMQRLEISPASVSALAIGGQAPRLLSVNETTAP